MLEFELLWKGALIGFAIAAPVGPIGILCIRRTLSDGRLAGFVSGLGAAGADAIYGLVAASLTWIGDSCRRSGIGSASSAASSCSISATWRSGQAGRSGRPGPATNGPVATSSRPCSGPLPTRSRPLLHRHLRRLDVAGPGGSVGRPESNFGHHDPRPRVFIGSSVWWLS